MHFETRRICPTTLEGALRFPVTFGRLLWFPYPQYNLCQYDCQVDNLGIFTLYEESAIFPMTCYKRANMCSIQGGERERGTLRGGNPRAPRATATTLWVQP
jgi:hypothetical protein